MLERGVSEVRGEESAKQLQMGGVAAVLIGFAVLMRLGEPLLLGRLTNFAPMTAIALLAGAAYSRRSVALAVILAATAVSDLLVNPILHGIAAPWYDGWYWQYISYAMITLVGRGLATRHSTLRVAFGAVSASMLFFVVSNFGVWASTGLYPKTAEGLVECFLMAVPFYQPTIAADLFFSVVLFGLYSLAQAASERRAGAGACDHVSGKSSQRLASGVL